MVFFLKHNNIFALNTKNIRAISARSGTSEPKIEFTVSETNNV